MANQSLMLHCGASHKTRDELANIETPKGTDTHKPIPHEFLLDKVTQSISKFGGFKIASEQHGVSKDGGEYFGLLRFCHEDNADYTSVVGLRNSHNKKFPAGFAFGSNVFVCDNLAFSGDVVVRCRHTKNIYDRILPQIQRGVNEVLAVKEKLDNQIATYKENDLSDANAHHLIIEMFRAGVFPNAALQHIIKEYHEPQHDAFKPRNVWSMFNAVTEVGKRWSAPNLVERTTKLHGVCDQYVAAAVNHRRTFAIPSLANLSA